MDRHADLPFHAQLRDILMRKIEDEYVPGQKLPSENELCETYGVSRTVVRQTLERMASDGIVTKVKGVGAFVNDRKVGTAFFQRAAGFYDEMTDRGHQVGSTTVEQSVQVASAELSSELNLAVGASVIHFDRIRYVDGQPSQISWTRLPHQRFAGLESLDMTDKSLYEVLATQYNCRPATGHRTIEARLVKPDEAELLEVALGSPVLVLRILSLDAESSPFESSYAIYRADMFKFEVELMTAASR